VAHDTDPAVQVVHHIPGRLRARVPAGARVEGLTEAVAELSGVISAAWSPVTRGLLVRYDPDAADESAIVAAIAEHAQLDVEMPAPTETNGHRPTLVGTVTSVVGEIDAGIARTTRGAVGLGVLVPVALTLWAGLEILRGRAAPLVWSSALWYAHGLFRDYVVSPRED
jgi:hypothetical protein